MHTPRRFSTYVRLRLFAEGREYPLAQVGPGYVIFREAADIPAGNAVLSIMVDDDDRRQTVRLPDGVQPFDLRARVTSAASPSSNQD